MFDGTDTRTNCGRDLNQGRRCAVQTMSLLHVDVSKTEINAHPGWFEGSTYQALCDAGGRSQGPIPSANQGPVQTANHAACPSRTGASCHVSESTPQIYIHGTPSSLVHCCGLATFTQLCLEKHGSRRSEPSSVTYFSSRLSGTAVRSCSQSTGC